VQPVAASEDDHVELAGDLSDEVLGGLPPLLSDSVQVLDEGALVEVLPLLNVDLVVRDRGVKVGSQRGRVAVMAPLRGSHHPGHHEPVNLLWGVRPRDVHHPRLDSVAVQRLPERLGTTKAVAVGLHTVSDPPQKIERSNLPRVLPGHHAHPGGYRYWRQGRLENPRSPLRNKSSQCR